MKRQWIWPTLALVFIVGGVIYFSSILSKKPEPYNGTELNGLASDFQLTDQNGTLIGLSDFQGKIVILTFMDSKCVETCPLTAADFRETYRQLNQNEASQVVFLGINVNVEASHVADVLEATQQWLLNEIPSWHFLTGNHEELEPVWKEYAIAVVPDPDGKEIMHTPGTYVIDQSGQKRWYISTPYFVEGNAELTAPLSELLVNHIRTILGENRSH